MRFIFTLFLSAICALGSLNAYAQCSTCTPDPTCYQPGGSQCPASGQAPPMYQNSLYSTVVTFDMPPDTNVSGIGTVNIVNVQYASISGLPIGISWACNSPGNGCQYNPSAGEVKACITFCGTPLSPPGNYTCTVNIYGTASTPIGNQTQYQPLQYVFTILADTASNGYFTLSNTSGCDSVDVDYEALLELPLPKVVSYEWDLGNGNVYSGPVPPTQSYDMPGEYYPTLTTHVKKLAVKKVTAQVSGNWWCGDVEETNWPVLGCTAQPDVYFQLQHGTSLYTSSSTSDNASGTWDNLNVSLESALFSINLWDEDGTSQDDNGGLTAVTITGAGSYNYTTSGGFGTIEIIELPDYDVITTDTIIVYALPAVVDIAVSPSDTLCEKESITLSVPAGNYTYEWYKDGTLISDTLGHSITVQDESGVYTVKLIDNLTGCSAFMNPTTIYFKPGVYNMFVSYANGILKCNPPTGFNYQWMFNGVPIFPGGTSGIYQPTATGNYSCVVTNSFGCADTTNILAVTSLAGINEAANISEQLNLFPNPATDIISVTFSSNGNCSADIRIMNNMGSVVRAQHVNCTDGNNTYEISVSDLAAGMYYIDFKTEAGFAAKRFIKQ